MIVEAFLRWAETAGAADRARAANALGRAYVQSSMPAEERRAAEMAMTYLLDDPSPRVRLSLAQAIARSAGVPRAVVLSLAEDQAEIAGQVILCSPVLTDADLVDLAARGSAMTRMLIASRGRVSRSVSAAVAEVGDEEEVLCLLENEGAVVPRSALSRIAQRMGDCREVRGLLLERGNLPSDARHVLMQRVSDALSGFGLIQAVVGAKRLERITREAGETATVAIAGDVPVEDIPVLVEHLRLCERLTPAFLMHALCSGKVDFFAGAIVSLSGCEDRRVRSILGTGRMHAVRALYESAGLARDISVVFVEATFLWREAARAATGTVVENISSRLLQRVRPNAGTSAAAIALLDMVEKLNIAEQRHSARDFASFAALAAA